MRLCSFDGCERPVEWGELCAGHRKQRVRGEQLRPLTLRTYSDPQTRASERLERAALALADAESDDAYTRAKKNHQDAARFFALGVGKSVTVEKAFSEVRAALRRLKRGLR